MCGPHHCLGRDAFASGPEILRRLLQLRQNASILEQGCAGFSPGSANRCDQFTRHPGRTSSPLRPRLSCRYTQVLKALGTGLGAGVPFKDVVVRRKPGGPPEVVLSGGAALAARDLRVTNWRLPDLTSC